MWQQLLYKIDYKHLYIYFVLFMFGFVLFLYLGHQSSDLSFLVVFSGYSGFLLQYNWPPRYSWNIVESGLKHHTTNQPIFIFVVNIAGILCIFQISSLTI